MPVEIRELVIRAVTTVQAEDSEEPEHARGRPQVQASLDDKEAIVQACVKQVLRILKKQRER